MSNSSTEEIGVNDLRSLLARTHVVATSNITSGDKGVSWDGYFSVFKDETCKKEALLGNVPVQIKTIHQEGTNNRFSISKADLENYKKECRVIYFYIVLNNKDKSTIFYLPLQLWDIEKMLQEYRHQEAKTFTFQRFPKQINDIISLLCEFIKESDSQKQLLPNIRSIDDLVKRKGNVPVSFEITIPKDSSIFLLPKIIKEKKPYIKYRSADTNLEYVVDKLTDANIFIEIKNFASVCFNDDCAFERVAAKGRGNSFTLECSKFLSIIIEEKRIRFKYNLLNGAIDDIIKVARFFQKLINVHSFFINSFEIKFTDKQLNELRFRIGTRIEFLCRYDDLRRTLSINKEPIFSEAKEKDYMLFEKICSCVLDGKAIDKLNVENGLMIFSLFGLNLLFCVVSSDDSSFIMNWLDDRYISLTSVDNPNDKLSPYYYLESQKINWFFKVDNINIDLIEDNVFGDNMDNFKCTCVSNIIINMLLLFDKTKNNHVLDVASRLSNRLILLQPEDVIVVINNAQICFRQNNLSCDQKQKIMNIADLYSDNNVIRFACHLLNGNKQKAEELFNKLTNEELKILRKWPIYNLYKAT